MSMGGVMPLTIGSVVGVIAAWTVTVGVVAIGTALVVLN